MQWEAIPSGRRGRQQAYSDAAIHACLTLKILPGLPLRQATGCVARLLELSGPGWSVPDFSTLPRRHRGPRCCSYHPAGTERQAMEARHSRSPGAQRDPASIEAVGPGALAELERVSPPQQGRNENELREAGRPTVDVAGP